MGWANAQRYLLTGDQWTAAESHRLGLVQEVVPVGVQYAKAREIAERIAKAAPLGVQAVPKATRLAAVEGEGKAIPTLFDNMITVVNSDESTEGGQPFVERRGEGFQVRFGVGRTGRE